MQVVDPVPADEPDGAVRRHRDRPHQAVASLTAPGAAGAVLIERRCQRYFTERTYQDAKSELGSDDFQALKYRAVEHHMALTAAATWFIAETKLKWRIAYERDRELARQLEVDVLPALSTANVRELLQDVLPVPQLSPSRRGTWWPRIWSNGRVPPQFVCEHRVLTMIPAKLTLSRYIFHVLGRYFVEESREKISLYFIATIQFPWLCDISNNGIIY